MKFIKVFDEHADYTTFMEDNLNFPHVSYCRDQKNIIHYNYWDGLDSSQLSHAHIQEEIRIRYDYAYNGTIVCDEGFEVYECTIMMGEDDITSTAWDPETNGIHIDKVTDKVTVTAQIMYSLPETYVRVEGIKNPSNAYLNTGYTCNKYSRIETKTNIVRNYQFIACSRSTGNTGMQGSGFIYYNNALYSFSATSVVLQKGYNLVGNTYTLVQDNYLGYCYVDGVQGSKYIKGSSDTNSIYLFSRQGGGDATGSEGQILPYFKIYDYQTTSYVRYYIPCINENGVAGFFDAARGIFQGSGNSTAFEPVFEGNTEISKIFTSRTTANSSILNMQTAKLTSIKGNTLVWNQLLNSEAEYVYAAAFSQSMNTLGVKPKLNDKIYISADVKKSLDFTSYDTDAGNRLVLCQSGNTFGGQVSFRTIPKDNEYHRIYGRPTNANATNNALGVQEHGYSAGSVTIKNMMALNLTTMFGAGYEPTAAQFKTWFPLDFYNKDNGRFLNFTSTQLVSKDSEQNTIWSVNLNVSTLTGMPSYQKYWNQLAMTSEETTCSSETEIFFSTTTLYNNIEVEHKFYIQADVKKSTDFVASTAENYSQRLTFADSGSSWGSSITVKDVPTDNTYHTVSGITKNNDSRNTNLSIFLVSHTAGYISVKNVMCIDLTKIYGQGKEPTDPAVFKSDFNRWFGRAIAYEPYNNGTTPSGTSSVIFPNGMRSTPVAYDEIKKEDDNWVAYKRIKCLNLGNYTYTYNSDFKMFLGPTLSDGKYYDTNNSQINTKGYPTQWSFTTTNSESIPYGIILTSSNYGTDNKILKIRDINYTDATTLKNALQNHYLNYELNYPIRYILDNPISNIYKAETNGIEQILPENGKTPTTAPANLDITYKI